MSPFKRKKKDPPQDVGAQNISIANNIIHGGSSPETAKAVIALAESNKAIAEANRAAAEILQPSPGSSYGIFIGKQVKEPSA